MFTNYNRIESLISEIAANESENRHAIFDMLSIDKNHATKIAKALENNRYLEYISFYDCQLDEEKIKILKDGIMKNTTLMEVKIEWFHDDPDLLKQIRNDIEKHLENNKNNYQTKPHCN